MSLEDLKQAVCAANLDLLKYNLVSLTWGNVSGIDREKGLVVIKPSGVPYESLTSEHMVVIDLEGRKFEGSLNPSSDTPSHLILYKAFPEISGITHTHSEYAVMFAQAHMEIPCLGTTHADHFNGSIPITRMITKEEVDNAYEKNTGSVIVERFKNLDPLEMPAVLIPGHGAFTWGKTPADSLKHSLILERVAKMAWGTLMLNPDSRPLAKYLQDKHYQRKHGTKAYYGQKKKEQGHE
jgi:L-ribulose-5-phosphate 4-epimerase